MITQLLIPTGRQGTATVLSEMSELVRASARDPSVRRLSLDLMRTVYASRYADFVWGLTNFFRRHFRFVDEPDEMISAPGAHVRAINESGTTWGDCDDAAVFAASLMYSVGFAVRFRAILEQPDGSFGHVFAEYRAPDSIVWAVFDPTVPFRPTYDASLVMDV